VALNVTGAAGQSVPLQQWRNNTPTVLAFVDQNGTFFPLTGTTSAPPIDLRAGSLVNSGTIGGAIEYDGTVAYLAPNSTSTLTTNGGRGLLASPFFFGLNGARTLTAGITTAQSMFGVGISLAASTTYEIEIQGTVLFTTNSPVPNTLSSILNFSNVPTTTNPWLIGGLDGANTISRFYSGLPLTASIYISPSTAATYNVNFHVRGLVRTNLATTFTPQVILNGNNTSQFTVISNSYVKVTPVGTGSVTGVGAWA
jgi:hypothetical protein